jgi:hypothetical protein
MRKTPDSFPIVLALAAFVLMFLGQASYERLADGWMAQRLEPRLGAAAAELVERFFTVALAGAVALYVVGGLYFYLRRAFAAQSRAAPPGAAPSRAEPKPARGRPRAGAQRDVWLYDAICRIFLGTWEQIPLRRGKLALDGADAEVLHDLVTRHIRQLAAEGALPIWGKRPGYWAHWEQAPAAFWRQHQVDYQSFLEADPKLLHALPCNGAGHVAPLGALMTSRAAVEAFCDSVAL